MIASYQKQYDGLLVADVNAEGITKESLAENVAALQALADEVEADSQKRDVWESDDAKVVFTAKITEALEADNAKIAEIEEAERIEAERIASEKQAAATSASQSYGSGSGYYDSGYSEGYSNSGGASGSGGGSSGGGSSTGSYWGNIGDESGWGDRFYYDPTKPGWFDEQLG